MALIKANVAVYAEAVNRRTTASAIEGEFMTRINNMRILLNEDAGGGLDDVQASAIAAKVARLNGFISNYALRQTAVDDVFAASVPVEFDTDGVTIIPIP